MASMSHLPFHRRAISNPNPLVKTLFSIAERKKSNIVVSADLTTTDELLGLADTIGPYIVVFKTHIDIVSDFGERTINGLKSLAQRHDFLFFEDRKFVDIGNTVQMQYHQGALKISEWAHLVNASILAGPAIIEALARTGTAESFPFKGQRGLLVLAEMTTKGSLATGDYTRSSVEVAREHKDFVVGFVATRSLSHIAKELGSVADEDFVVFTTGVNRSSSGDKLGQQYQTPTMAVERGADFIIAGRGIYAVPDPVESVKLYQEEGWRAYEQRTRPASDTTL